MKVTPFRRRAVFFSVTIGRQSRRLPSLLATAQQVGQLLVDDNIYFSVLRFANNSFRHVTAMS